MLITNTTAWQKWAVVHMPCVKFIADTQFGITRRLPLTHTCTHTPHRQTHACDAYPHTNENAMVKIQKKIKQKLNMDYAEKSLTLWTTNLILECSIDTQSHSRSFLLLSWNCDVSMTVTHTSFSVELCKMAML